ncbi:MAG: histidine phosphatase family protein [Candidatus Omnitrophota bacterium]|jgi:broad specificity phosphatase PhoE
MTRLVFIRHGITVWNAQRRYCGHKDVALSREGARQAAKLAGSLKTAEFDKIYCSDRKRAVQTCRIIFEQAKFIKVKGLKEINFGVLEGMKHKDIMLKYPDVYERWLEDPYKNHIPKAEKMKVFKKRVEGAVKRIIRSNRGKTVAIVCHGGVIGVFVCGILKSGNFWGRIPSAASVTVVEYKKGKARIKKFNDTAHLR